MNWRIFSLVFGLLVSSVLNLASPANSAGRWVWPMQPHTLAAGFDRPAQNWLPGHRGVDLVGQTGDLVFAAGSGTVTFAGNVAGKGVVVIRHGALRTTYEPVLSSIQLNSKVKVGDVIGSLQPGASHCSNSEAVSCLHWGLLRGENYLNPLSLVQKRVRLLPTLVGGPARILRGGDP